MNTPGGEGRKRALEMLGEMVPRSILSRAKGLAEEMEREERIRAYLAKRVHVLVLAVVACVFLGLFAAIGTTAILGRLGIEPGEHRIIVVLLTGTALLLVAFVPPLALVWHMEKNALHEMSKRE